MTHRSGKCLCGAVTFTVTAEPVAVRVCWCRDCLHIAGNGTVNMIVPTESLNYSGTIAEHTNKAASGNDMIRQFCPKCGCHLFASSSARPHFRVVRVGNLDDPSSVSPRQNIWTASAPKWACFDPQIEQVDRQPVPPPPPQLR